MIASCGVPQRGDGDDRGEAAAVLADIGQLVDVLDAARGLEHQRLEAGCDRRAELDAQRVGARDHLLGVRDVGRRDLVHHLRGRVAQHPLGPDVEDLDDSLRVGGDAREVGALEDGALERPRPQEGLCMLHVHREGIRVGDISVAGRHVVSAHVHSRADLSRPRPRSNDSDIRTLDDEEQEAGHWKRPGTTPHEGKYQRRSGTSVTVGVTCLTRSVATVRDARGELGRSAALEVTWTSS